jgi:CubicO group peptidase (beta-lactamase class C family)
MKKITVILLVSLVSVLSTNGQSITRIDGTKISVDSLQNYITDRMHAAKVTGLCISVFNNNVPVFTKAFGLANASKNEPLKTSSILSAASFSKAVFAYIVMKLVEEKVIDLDAPLVSYLSKPLPDYKMQGSYRDYNDLKNDERYKKITPRMCLDHTTGFPNSRDFEPDKKLKIKYEPGTHYSYSGEGLVLLQFVIEQHTGKNLEEIAQQNVFKPFGMENTSYVWQEHFNDHLAYGHNSEGQKYQFYKRSEPNAAGSLLTSFDDYIKFYTAVMQEKGLKKTSFDEMFKPQISIKSKQQFGPEALLNTGDNDNIKLSYGLVFGVFNTTYGAAFFKEGHGDGWQHYSVCFRDKNIAVVIMTNSDNSESIFKELLSDAIGDNFTPWYWENYIPIGHHKAKEGYAFYCEPCGAACDTIAHEYPGICPICKMPLIEKKIPDLIK